MAPVYLIIKLTVPVIDDEEESWNYPLTIIQSLAAPFMFYVLLEQYEEDEIGDLGDPMGIEFCNVIGRIEPHNQRMGSRETLLTSQKRNGKCAFLQQDPVKARFSKDF